MDSAERLCKEIALIDHGRAVLDGPLPSIKEKFGTNSLRLEYDGDGSFLKDLSIVKSLNDYGQYVELELSPGADEQLVLRAAQERLRLRRFELVTPSLHNIFIQQVGRKEVDA